MNDPHVAAVKYRVEASPGFSFNHPPRLDKENDAFVLSLAENVLTVTMKDHHATEESARASIEPYLRAWEIASSLQCGRQMMTFHFVSAELVDRNPLPRTGHVLHAQCGGFVIAGGDATFTVGLGKYPEPPSGFLATDDVKIM